MLRGQFPEPAMYATLIATLLAACAANLACLLGHF
jgi:hypothetical protein